MLMKLFFVFLVLLFGLLMFVTGVLAPTEVSKETSRIAHKVMSALPIGGTSTAPAEEPPQPPGQGKNQEEAPVATETLLLPTPLPAQGLYALQLAQFGNAASAEILMTRLKAAGITGKVIRAIDKQGQTWWIVAAGSYGQPDEARTARPVIAKEIGGITEMPVILLPGAASTPSAASPNIGSATSPSAPPTANPSKS